MGTFWKIEDKLRTSIKIGRFEYELLDPVKLVNNVPHNISERGRKASANLIAIAIFQEILSELFDAKDKILDHLSQTVEELAAERRKQ